jgi:hypothetical protein
VQAAEPEGWKRVPIKPTPEMCHVGRYGGDKDAPAYGEKPAEGVTAWPFVADHTAEQIYQSMLAAAPAHPAEGVPAQDVEIKVSAVMLKVAALIEKRVEVEPCAEAEAELLKFLRAAFAATQPAAQGVDVVQAAKALCKHAAKVQNVNFDDYWLIHAEEFKEEAQIVLDAAQAKQGEQQ